MNTQHLGISKAMRMFSDLIIELVGTSLRLSLMNLD